MTGETLDWAKLIDYNVIIITEAEFSDNPAFVRPFKAKTFDDFKVAEGEAMRTGGVTILTGFRRGRCTVLVERASFTGAIRAATL